MTAAASAPSPTSAAPAPTTLGQLRAGGHRHRSVKEELRGNLIARLRGGQPLVSGVVGFDETVIPELERGLLAGHDLILLGERGQAKTRIVRRLVELLDEWTPVVAGCELNSHPYAPLSAFARDLVADRGDDTPVAWLHRDRRFNEKLATPDTAVADLVGDVDPIKVAEGRHLGDERTIHFGLLPRTNRGIFAVNELPDLPERIQVALLNVLEERDVQVRGYTIRLPLDVLLVATANPDDYTNRGRIISPLKDRFGSQVRTHYPRTVTDEIAIMRQESAPPPGDIEVRIPSYLEEVVAELTALLRRSPQVNQRSGVSVRYSIGARETMIAGAVRRAVHAGEPEAVPRVVDLWAVVPAALGRIEFDTLEEGNETAIVGDALRRAVLTVWQRHLGGEDLSGLLARFSEGLEVETTDTMAASELLGQFGDRVDGLARWMERLDVAAESPTMAASVLEFVLEGLHLGRRINKESVDVAGRWRFGA